MADTEYDYTVSPVAIDSLTQQIQQSSITTALDYINILGSAVSIFFKAALSSADKTTLDAVVAAHTGVPLPSNTAQLVDITTALPTFSAKTIVVNGVTKSLYKRFTGISQVLTSGANTFAWTQSAFPWVKFVGVEIIGAELGDTCSFYVLDTATGTYSGHANYPLNQFGFTANVAPNFYNHTATYDADLYQNLQLQFVYTSASAKTVYINFDMNEVK